MRKRFLVNRNEFYKSEEMFPCKQERVLENEETFPGNQEHVLEK